MSSNIRPRNLQIVLVIMLAVFKFNTASAQDKVTDVIGQKYRPLYHFSPKSGWIGDPDGLVFHKGYYHLFWWGHAISKDLVHWHEMPKALQGGDGSFTYFSGSVAVDRYNTSGFGNNSMIAVYTRHVAGDSLPETQAISVSTNGGTSFNYYAKNPVLDIKKVFFRDPQVFFYQPDQKWKMVVTLPDIQQIHIYESKDLKNWLYCSSFSGLGAKNSFWECPDLYELPVVGTKQKKWVMVIGRGPNRVQYFTGSFNGKTFTPDAVMAAYLKTGKGLDGLIFEDFETGYAAWQVNGTAFSKTTSPGISDFLGKHYGGSSAGQPGTGTLKSKPFLIRKKAINFLLSGGNHPDTTCVRLIIDGKVYRTATGDNTKVMKWNGWDVRDLIGKKACIEIKDQSTDIANGYISVDHILFSDRLMNQQMEHALWLDYGLDYYATRTWRNYYHSSMLKDTVVSLSWMGNWDYANKVPTTWGKGFESLPRKLALKQTAVGYQLIQQPITQLQQLRQKLHHISGVVVSGSQSLTNFKPQKNCYEIIAEFRPATNAVFGLNLLEGEGRQLTLRYDPVVGVLSLDRTNCTDFLTDPQFTKLFGKKMNAPLRMQNGILRLHIFVDQSSIEIFANDGEAVISATTFPSAKQLGIHLVSNGGATKLVDLKAWELNSIYSADPSEVKKD